METNCAPLGWGTAVPTDAMGHLLTSRGDLPVETRSDAETLSDLRQGGLLRGSDPEWFLSWLISDVNARNVSPIFDAGSKLREGNEQETGHRLAYSSALMIPLRFLVSSLAVWRITHLLAEEDGPWDSIVKLREKIRWRWLGSALDCFYCLSVWIAVVYPKNLVAFDF